MLVSVCTPDVIAPFVELIITSVPGVWDAFGSHLSNTISPDAMACVGENEHGPMSLNSDSLNSESRLRADIVALLKSTLERTDE